MDRLDPEETVGRGRHCDVGVYHGDSRVFCDWVVNSQVLSMRMVDFWSAEWIILGVVEDEVIYNKGIIRLVTYNVCTRTQNKIPNTVTIIDGYA